MSVAWQPQTYALKGHRFESTRSTHKAIRQSRELKDKERESGMARETTRRQKKASLPKKSMYCKGWSYIETYIKRQNSNTKYY